MAKQLLSPHFSFEELTVTSNASLQSLNRLVDDAQMGKLIVLANHCEEMREICGDKTMIIHSGYRNPDINSITPGSSPTSQHPRCEAVDFNVVEQDLEETFNLLLSEARAGNF